MDSQLLTVNDVAHRLRVTPAMVRKLLFERRLPRVKIGRCVRVREDDLEALIKLGMIPASQERRDKHAKPER